MRAMIAVVAMPDAAPVIQAPTVTARRPERAANSSTKAAKASGASETVNAAASSGRPASRR